MLFCIIHFSMKKNRISRKEKVRDLLIISKKRYSKIIISTHSLNKINQIVIITGLSFAMTTIFKPKILSKRNLLVSLIIRKLWKRSLRIIPLKWAVVLNEKKLRNSNNFLSKRILKLNLHLRNQRKRNLISKRKIYLSLKGKRIFLLLNSRKRRVCLKA